MATTKTSTSATSASRATKRAVTPLPSPDDAPTSAPSAQPRSLRPVRPVQAALPDRVPAEPTGSKPSRRRSARPANAPTLEASGPAPEPEAAPTPQGKQARVIAMLRRPEGATIVQLMEATGWIAHSVRGMISGALKRKLGLVVESSLDPDRGRVYRIPTPMPLSPAGVTSPTKQRRSKGRGGPAAERPCAAG